MFIAVETLIDIQEGTVRFDEWKNGVGIRDSDGAALQFQSTGTALDIVLEATSFSIDYEDGRSKVRLHRTFYDTDSMRKLAKVLLDEADKIDSYIAKIM